MSARNDRPAPRLIKVVNIKTRTSHHEILTMSGAGFILNDRLTDLPAARLFRALGALLAKAIVDGVPVQAWFNGPLVYPLLRVSSPFFAC